jgi:hypothetical protein
VYPSLHVSVAEIWHELPPDDPLAGPATHVMPTCASMVVEASMVTTGASEPAAASDPPLELPGPPLEPPEPDDPPSLPEPEGSVCPPHPSTAATPSATTIDVLMRRTVAPPRGRATFGSPCRVIHTA